MFNDNKEWPAEYTVSSSTIPSLGTVAKHEDSVVTKIIREAIIGKGIVCVIATSFWQNEGKRCVWQGIHDSGLCRRAHLDWWI
ncbi:hypothetical protein DPMN_006522 [Dreissena polymorpha]|uniref:Uncharacterized protein n=1 Tax=Dreissena polymorpha TaxID=45954 RepID=A0A9D4MUR1_DREPO|nr:hypothetical protein DPMN_006522 [Dreissena polymorpha]